MIKTDTKDRVIPANEARAVPLYSSRVQAGFPSTVDDSVELSLDLNRYVIRHPSSTFFIKVEGDSMEGAGIFSGDILAVDRSLEPKHNSIVVAVVYDELTVKRLSLEKGKTFLFAENPNYEPIEITEEMSSFIWGVVTHSVRKF